MFGEQVKWNHRNLPQQKMAREERENQTQCGQSFSTSKFSDRRRKRPVGCNNR
jgi:hypothetical protein